MQVLNEPESVSRQPEANRSGDDLSGACSSPRHHRSRRLLDALAHAGNLWSHHRTAGSQTPWVLKPLFEFLRRYPAVTAFFLVAAGVVLARHVTPSFLYWSFAALALPLLLLPSTLRSEHKTFLWLIGPLMCFLSGLSFGLMDLSKGATFAPLPEKRTIHAVVSGMLSSAPGHRVLLLGEGVDVPGGSPLPGHGRLSLRDNHAPLCAGDKIAFRARITKPANRGNPGEYDWDMHCRSEGILWLASARGEDAILLLRRAAWYNPRTIVSRLRDALTHFLENNSTGDVRAVLKGIIIGDRGEIDASLNKSYAKSGLAHLLAASGMNVGMVAVVAILLVRCGAWTAPRILLLWPLRKMSAAASVPIILVYCLIVGAQTPIMRATIMGLVFVAALLADRRWYSPNSLALAGVILLLLYPLSLFTPSFQLSFAAVFGILLVVPSFLNRLSSESARAESGAQAQTDIYSEIVKTKVWPWLRPVATLVVTSVAATLAVTPFLATTFHSFPLYTLPANLIGVPLMAVAMPVGLIAAVVGLVAPGLGGLILVPAEFLVRLINETARFFSEMPGSVLRFPEIGQMEFALLAVCVLSALLFMRQPHRNRVPALFVAAGCLIGVFVVSPCVRSQGEDLTVVFFNVGRGDAAFVQAPGSKGLLIDGGIRSQYFDAGTTILIPFFESRGITSAEGIIMTHPDMDHMGGLLSVIERARPGYLFWNAIDVKTPFLKQILSSASSSGTPVLSVDRNAPAIQLGKGSLRFLNPPAKPLGATYPHRDVNNASVVCRLDYGEISFLFTGDIEMEAEDELLRAGVPLKASVLKVAHHGCKTSTGVRFLEAVSPRVAVISCDDYASGSCPHKTVLQRLESVGAEVLWTGRHGAVTIRTDGKQMKVGPVRQQGVTAASRSSVRMTSGVYEHGISGKRETGNERDILRSIADP